MREHPVDGDGNCQFRALAHQLSGSAARHAAVRATVAKQLAAHRDRYEQFCIFEKKDADFDAFLARIATDGEWGDHVTLQAAADAYNVAIVLVTSYEEKGILRVEPHAAETNRTIWVAFWAEIHYASIVDRST